jgi:hypothetical protein
MPTHDHAAELRRRAADLRRLAVHLSATPLDDLAGWAGPETWMSPRASELRAQLGVDRARLQESVDDLYRHARWLELQAEAAAATEAATSLVG